MRLTRLALVNSILAVACGSSSPPAKPPSAPAGLTAVGGKGQVSLSWTAAAGADSYAVLRGDAAGAETPLATATVTTYTDSAVTAGHTYFYVVQAVNKAGKSGNSNEASATTVPAAPAGLTATGGVGQVALAWTAVTGATSYSVQRGAPGGPYAEVGAPAQNSYTDTTVAAGTTYGYVVAAITPQGRTDDSAEATALTAPAAVSGLTVTTTDTTALVQWTASPGAAGYDVSRAPGGAVVSNLTATSVSDSGLTPNTAYVYTVRAKNASGTSADATANATTAPVAPTAVSAVASNHHVTLTWTAAAGAGSGGYRVLRATSASGPFAPAGTASGLTFTDKLLTNNTTYYYVVHTIGGSGESGDSNQAGATPYIEICAVDGSSYDVSVFDGTASGNAAPKRSFGWQTGIAEGTGIAVDGVNSIVYIASRYTHSVNLYPLSVAGDTAPTSTLSVSGEPTAITYDAGNKELYVAVRGPSNTDINVYSTDPSLHTTPARTLTLGGGSVTGVTVIGTQIAVLNANLIVMYARTDSGSNVTPQNIIQPGSPITALTSLYGGVYDSTDDAIWVAYTAFPGGVPTGHATSYSRTTTTVPAPAIKNIDPDPSFPMNFARGLWLDGTTNVWISATNTTQRNKDALYKFTRATNGVLVDGIVGPTNTLLYQPSAMAYDATNSRQWVLNGSAGALAFRKTDSGDVAPRQQLDGSTTGIYDSVSIAADRGSDEIVTLNRAPTQSLVIHPRSASGDVTPSRTLSGNNTTLDAYDEYSVAVDSGNGEYWVSESRTGLAVFGRAQSGNVAPLRPPLAGTTNFNLGLPAFLAFDSTAGAIVATSTSITVANQGDLQAWHRTDSGDVAAAFDGTFTLGSRQLVGLSIDLTHDELFSSDGAVTTVYPRAFASGPLTPLRTLTVFGAPVVDGEGDELYVWKAQSIAVYPRTSTGTPSPTRTISGAATGLYNTRALAICN